MATPRRNRGVQPNSGSPRTTNTRGGPGPGGTGPSQGGSSGLRGGIPPTAPARARGASPFSLYGRNRGGGPPTSSQPPSGQPSSAPAQSSITSPPSPVNPWTRGSPARATTTSQPLRNPQHRGGGPLPVSSHGSMSSSTPQIVRDADGPPPTVEGLPSDPISPPTLVSPAPLSEGLLTTASESPGDGAPPLPSPPSRPGAGKAGTSVKVQANFFRVNIQGQCIYEYTVTISPEPLPSRKFELFKLLERSRAQEWREFIPFIAHDRHSKLYSAKELPQPLVVDVIEKVGPREHTFTFNIKKNCELKLEDLSKFLKGNLEYRNYNTSPIIGAYNLILQKFASTTAMRVGGGDEVRSGCYYFKDTEYRSGLPKYLQPQRSLSDRLQAWGGVFVSVRPVRNQLMVNVGLCVSAFHKSRTLGEAISIFRRASHGADPTRFLQKLKVTSQYRGYVTTMRVQEVVDTPPASLRFQWGDEEISVADYLKQRYNTTLRHPKDWPVINVAGKKSPHPVYVPVELCMIADDQLYRGKLDDNEAREMIKFACRKPDDNRVLIDEGLRLLGFSKPNMQGVKQSMPTNVKTDIAALGNFDVTVDPHMVDILARVLPCPKLQYGNRKIDNIRDGGWNTLGCKFVRGAVVESWCVLNVRDGPMTMPNSSDLTLDTLCKAFERKCKECGIVFKGLPTTLKTEQLPDIQRDAYRREALAEVHRVIKHWCNANAMRSTANRSKSSFILVLLRRRDNFIYPGIKRMCDLEFGIHTVHVLVPKLGGTTSKLDQYFANVALKLNIKLGGVNHLLGENDVRWLKQKKTMVVGMDVTHPSPGSHLGTPSIAAVVASVDDSFVQFPASLRCQISKQEMIGDLRAMFNERLHAYGGRPGILPERVIVYRDGVSETQYEAVLRDELQSIKGAFADKYGNLPHPPLTLVVCGKRHHVRLFPAQDQTSNTTSAKDRSGNTLPGTVVDNTITSVFYFDFYLQAHTAIQGHVRGTHYVVLYDENNFGSDEVQQGTYNASYLYARASKSVSLVPPAYYADLACERGRCYLNNFFDGNALEEDRKQSAGGDGDSKEDDGKLVFSKALRAWGEGVHANLKDSMFYI